MKSFMKTDSIRDGFMKSALGGASIPKREAHLHRTPQRSTLQRNKAFGIFMNASHFELYH